MPAPGIDETLAFLRDQLIQAGPSGECEIVETHMSWVLLGARHALKLKKPVRSALFDFSTPAARERNAREEVRLNRRLDADVYLGVLALQWDGSRLSLCAPEEQDARLPTVDWIVRMKRLPRHLMLDQALAGRVVSPHDVQAVLGVLLPFYRRAGAAGVDGADHLGRMQQEQSHNREVLCMPRFGLGQATPVLARLDAALARHAGPLRARAGRVVEGHGDLRPEHVCLLDPPVVIDALEFNARLRQVDPLDELAFLGMECTQAGAPWVGRQILAAAGRELSDDPPEPLWALYTANRAALRARLAAAHLLDEAPRTPHRWLPLAERYLALAVEALDELDRLMPPGSSS